MFHPQTKTLEDTLFAAIDLETTGLDRSKDRVIEVGVQRFTLEKTGSTYTSLINPGIEIPDEVSTLTGISSADVRQSPKFEDVKVLIEAALDGAVLIGHNISFDLAFLRRYGIDINFQFIDTLELAYFLEGNSPDYSLQTLVRSYGLSGGREHRALDDCISTMRLFLKLLEKILELPTQTLSMLYLLSQKANWSLEPLFRQCIAEKSTTLSSRNRKPAAQTEHASPTSTPPEIGNNPKDDLELAFGPQGSLSKELHDYEYRFEQFQMAKKVAAALKDSHKLILEAGTGIGKSIAYLIPALIHSIRTNSKVIISTNTINLQEQLVSDDIPTSIRVLESMGFEEEWDSVLCVLKGRSNYLCRRRFDNLLTKQVIDKEECLLMAKILVWLDTTQTGDRSELNLTRKSHGRLWHRISAEGSGLCETPMGTCFLRQARDSASRSNLIITNHSLLLADAGSGGGILPNYQDLVIDEAHHLEDQATRSFGFDINPGTVNELLNQLTGPDSSVDIASKLLSNIFAVEKKKLTTISTVGHLSELVERAKVGFGTLFDLLGKQTHRDPSANRNGPLRLGYDVDDPTWNSICTLTDNLDLQIREILGNLDALILMLESEINHGQVQNSHNDLVGYKNSLIELHQHLLEGILNPSESSVYWSNPTNRPNAAGLCMAPIEVGETLNEAIFSQKKSIILTSATLATDNTFRHLEQRLGFEPDDEATLASPFEYESLSLMLLPTDLPDPRSQHYLDELSTVIMESSISANGRTLALFTSHEALRHVYRQISHKLLSKGIRVLAQGVSGNTQNLIEQLRKNSKSVLLGTSSMWEGIDVRGDALQVVIVTRLPFEVPTDPIYQARSDRYKNGFMEYGVPGAIMRFRQGFGRLIRSSNDRGVFIVVDNRIFKNNYGHKFTESLPTMRVEKCESKSLGDHIKHWLNQSKPQ